MTRILLSKTKRIEHLNWWHTCDRKNRQRTNQETPRRVVSESIGIFNNSANPFASLGKLLGIESTITNKASLRTALDDLIAKESDELTKLLTGKLKQAGLGDVTKKITFAEDKDGNIVIEGNISARQKRQLAKIINDDPELVERIKTQKARMEIAEELNKPEFDEEGKRSPIDLSDKKFDVARTQFLKDFLRQNGASLDGVADGNIEQLTDLLSLYPELNEEILAYIDRENAPQASPSWTPGEAIKLHDGKEEKSTAVRSLFSMKRGVLTEATDETPDFRAELGKLRQGIWAAIDGDIDGDDGYNELYAAMPDMMIRNFNMQFDHNGKLRIIDVETWGNDPDANKQAEKVLNTWFGGSVQDVALAMLDAHDDEHGDVKEFKHHIVATGFDYEIFSPDADRAALDEIAELSAEIGTALGGYFGKTMGIKNPFAITFGNDGLLSLGDGGALTSLESQAVRQVLDDLNRYLRAERAGEDTEDMLSPQLTGIGEKFLALKEAQEKIHDKSLLPKDGVRFGVNG